MAAATGAAAVLGGCSASLARPTSSPSTATSTVAAIAASDTIIPAATPTEVSWQALTPLQKINELELLNYPPKKDFDPNRELISAVADYFCQIIKPSLSADKLKKSVFLVGTDEFVDQVEEGNFLGTKKPLTPEERKFAAENILQIFTADRKIYMNNDYLNTYSAFLQSSSIKKGMGKKDIRTVGLKSLLLNGFAQASQTAEEITIDPPLPMKFANGTMECNNLIGFTVECKFGNGKVVLPVHNAVSEFVARFVATKDNGSYLSFNQPSLEAAMIIFDLNNRSQITPEEFIDYANGKGDLADLFKKWGTIKDKNNPDERSAHSALIIIGLVVEGIISSAEAKQRLDLLFVPSNPLQASLQLSDVSFSSLLKPHIPVATLYRWDGPENSIESIDKAFLI